MARVIGGLLLRFGAMMLLAFASRPACAQLADLSRVNVQVNGTSLSAATVPAGTANYHIAMVADPVLSGGDVFEIIASDPAVIVSLLLPGGTEVTSTNAATLGFTYSAFMNSANVASILAGTFNLAGAHSVITLPPAQVPGTYTIKVNGAAAQADVLVTVSFVTSSPVRAGVTTDKGTYQVGDTVVLTGLAFNDSAPITDATITARVIDTKNLAANAPDIPLLDSGQYDNAGGDGLYTGTYTATAAGTFLAVVRATGVAATGPYVRSASATFTVVQPMASFSSFSDTAIDDNANGKKDRVVVSALINVKTVATYRVGIALQASNGNVIKASTTAVLAAGNQTVPLSFKSTDILAKLAVNGPYTMRDAALVVIDGVRNPMVDFQDTAGTTAAYALSSMDVGSALYFTGQSTVTPLDTNADGKFDTLRVHSTVVVPILATYTWSGRLVNAKGTQIAFFNTQQTLTAGSNNINFDFSGSAIGQTCSSGALSVRSVAVFGGGASVMADHLVDTPTFTAAQFANAACFLVSATPNAGAFTAGTSQPFTFTFTDAAGSGDLSTVSILIGSSTTPGNACYVAWNRSDHTIRIYDDAGDGMYTYAPDTINQFGNSQCTMFYNNPVVESGNNLTLTLSLTFSPAFAGTRNIFLQAQNAGGTDTGLQLFGALGVLLTSVCDIDADGNTTVTDAQALLNKALGVSTRGNDLNTDGFVNVVDVQNVINAITHQACVTR